jgi:hypothetical protein
MVEVPREQIVFRQVQIGQGDLIHAAVTEGSLLLPGPLSKRHILPRIDQVVEKVRDEVWLGSAGRPIGEHRIGDELQVRIPRQVVVVHPPVVRCLIEKSACLTKAARFLKDRPGVRPNPLLLCVIDG